MNVSLDGFMAGPNGELDWATIDAEYHTFVNEQPRDGYWWGRGLYSLMAEFWPTADQDPAAEPYVAEYARIWRAMPKVVFSRTLERVDWNTRLERGDAVAEVKRLKEASSGTYDVGGPTFAASLSEHGLIDEFEVFVHPVVLGAGRPYLRVPMQVRLLETRTFGSGVVLLRYARA
jgi:dihydrofolate reductase